MYIKESYMYCKNCGKEIEDDSSFCPFCGSTVEKKVSDKKEHGSDKEDSANGLGMSGFVVSIVALVYTLFLKADNNLIEVSLFGSLALGITGLVLSCVGMVMDKSKKNRLAFAGFIIGAVALMGCGVRWMGFGDLFNSCK